MAPSETPAELAWLRPDEAATFLGIGPTKLELWAKAGLIRTYKLGRRGAVLFRRSDLQNILESQAPPDPDASE